MNNYNTGIRNTIYYTENQLKYDKFTRLKLFVD